MALTLFPHSTYAYELMGEPAETLERLKRRTEITDSLTSKRTDRSFRGQIEGSKYRIISSAVGRGAFCVLAGELDGRTGSVLVTIHSAFKVLLGIIMFFPVIGWVAQLYTGIAHPFFLLVVVFIQIALIRYVLIEQAFRQLSKQSISRFSDVVDTKWTKKTEQDKA